MSESTRRKHSGRRDTATQRYNAAQAAKDGTAPRSKMGTGAVAASIGVVIVVIALASLVWILTSRTIAEQKAQIRDRAEQALVGQAATIAETIGHELGMIDQSLTIIQGMWQANSDSVELAKLKDKMPALTSVTDDLFIADQDGIIKQDILPQAINQGVGSAYTPFPRGSLEQFLGDGTKPKELHELAGEPTAPIDARLFGIYMARPLDHPKGWVLGASYRSTELPKLFAAANLGFNPIAGLVDTTHGNLQAIIGPAARHPKVGLQNTPLLDLIDRNESGTWIGMTEADGVERIHAFHRVAGRDMAVLVAANLSEVMAPADALTDATTSVAIIATGLLVAIGAVLLWELYNMRSNQRKQRTLERTRGEVDRLRGEEAAYANRLALNAARLRVVLDDSAEGIALFDADRLLLHWNRPFAAALGIDLRPEMPLIALLRDHMGWGLGEVEADVEAESTRRAALLINGDAAGLTVQAANGEPLNLRGLPVPEGGLILKLSAIAPVESGTGPTDW